MEFNRFFYSQGVIKMKFNQLVCALCISSPIAATANDHATQKWDGLYIGAKAGYARGDTAFASMLRPDYSVNPRRHCMHALPSNTEFS